MQKQIKHHLTPVQYMDLICIGSIFSTVYGFDLYLIYIPWKTWILRSLFQAKADKTLFNSSTVYAFDLYLIYIPWKTWILRSLLHEKADKTSFNYSTVYGFDLYSMENIDSEVFITCKRR